MLRASSEILKVVLTKPYTFVLVGCYLIAFAQPAGAFFVKPSVQETWGSGNYVGTHDYVDFGDALHFKPAFSAYHSSASSGTYKTFSLDSMYEWRDYSLDFLFGFTPTLNAYNSSFVGGRISRFIDFESDGDGDVRAKEKLPRGKFFKNFDYSVGLTRTSHREQVITPVLKAGPKTILGSTGTVHIGQTDLEGSVAVGIPDLTISVDITKSVYDHDLAKLAVQSAQVVHLAGLNQTIQGFPDVNATEKIQLDFSKNVAPYFSYTYTSFKVSQPAASTFALGSRFFFMRVNLEASYQLYTQSGSPSINYYNLGASMKFE